MIYKSWHGFCLCGEEADFPSEAQVVSSPFAPLVFLVWRDPMKHRGYFAIHSLEELTEEEQKERIEEITERMATLGIPVIIDRSADEKEDLAKAEWIKVYGILFGKQDAAEKLFEVIEQKADTTKAEN